MVFVLQNDHIMQLLSFLIVPW